MIRNIKIERATLIAAVHHDVGEELDVPLHVDRDTATLLVRHGIASDTTEAESEAEPDPA